MLLDVLKGFVPALARMLFVSPHHLPGSSPAPRRCSGTGVRCSCASPRAGRWSRPAAACSSASRLGRGHAPGSSGWSLFLRLPLRVARVDRRRASRLPVVALRLRLSDVGHPLRRAARRRRSCSCTERTSPALRTRARRGTESRLPLRGARAQCVELAALAVARSSPRSGSRPARSPAAGAAVGRDGGRPPDIVTGQQVHAIVAVPSDGARHLRRRREPARRRRRLDDRLVDRPGPDADPPLRPGASSAGSPCLDISFVRLPEPALGLHRRRRDARRSADRRAAQRRRLLRHLQEVPRLLRRAVGADGRLRHRRRRLHHRPCLRGRLAHRLSRRSRRTRRRRTSCCTRSGRCRPARRSVPRPIAGHPCDAPDSTCSTRTRTGARCSSRCSTSTTTTTTAHRGSWNDIQDSLLAAAGSTLPPGRARRRDRRGTGTVSSDLPGLDCAAACTTQWDPGAIVTLDAVPPATALRPLDRRVHRQTARAR